MKRWIICIGLVIGCAATTRVATPPSTPQPLAAAPATEQAADEPLVTEAMRDFSRLERVYFEFNRSRLTPAARETLAENAETLKALPEVVIEIQGHADERGTAEYNLALGERRAWSILTYLRELGIDENRMRTISYGEEVPFDEGTREAVWSKNRRAEFRVVEGIIDVGTTD